MVLATPNRTKESCIKIIYIIYQNSSTTIFLIIATKVFVNLPITFNIKLPYLARGNGGVVYLPTVRLNLLYIECLQIHVSPSRKPVIFHGPCGNDTLAIMQSPGDNSKFKDKDPRNYMEIFLYSQEAFTEFIKGGPLPIDRARI